MIERQDVTVRRSETLLLMVLAVAGALVILLAIVTWLMRVLMRLGFGGGVGAASGGLSINWSPALLAAVIVFVLGVVLLRRRRR